MLVHTRTGVAAGLLVVLAATACGVATPSDAGHPVPGSELSHRAAGLAESRRLVRLVRVPPGATAVTSAPVPALRHPPEVTDSPYLLDVPRWWRLPISMAAAIGWLRAHRPRGLHASGSGSTSGPEGLTSELLSFADGTNGAYNSAMLVLDLVPDGAGASALRADGQVLWLPERPEAEQAPLDAARVVLLAYRGTPKDARARRVLRGAAAAKLARLIDALPRDNRGTHGCVMDTGSRIRATFASASGRLVFTEWQACDVVDVTSDGRPQPALLDSSSLERDLREELGPGAR